MKNLKTFYSFSPLLFMVCMISCGTGQTDIAKAALANKVSSESGGVLELSSFTKVNGEVATAYGMDIYTLEFTASITAKRLCIKPGNAFSGYWKDFRVLKREPTDGWEKMEQANALKLQPGTQTNVRGTIVLTKKENGWSVDQIEVKNGGF